MNSLSPFQNIHKDKTIIVCGCGESLNDLQGPERFITIGVNDVGRQFDPTYLVVVNPRHQFKNDRFHYVETSRAQAVFTQLDLGINHPHIVKFKLGERNGTDISDPNSLPYTQNSPYVALCLAAHMGAKSIGLIGVDFTDHHFFGKTGRHPLNGQFEKIDAEYRVLDEAFSKIGIEVLNLSSQSRLTAFKKNDLDKFCNLNAMSVSLKNDAQKITPRIFFVNYRFLSCGEVFTDGLAHAATDLGIVFESAYWDDTRLPEKIARYDPDLLFVVHGRRFSQKWGKRFSKFNSAVWLLDEPYEVDDTSRYSSNFNTVFVNDPNTIQRHQNAYYLPVGYDPHVYHSVPQTKKYDVGFIGGYNSVRQRFLEMLLQKGLLTYVIGGPWKGNLQKICLSTNIPAKQTAEYYRQTRIIVNVFRETHHFNQQNIQVFSFNPRSYEAVACGAVVVSEPREEIKKIFPEMPVFENSEQLVEIIKELLTDENKYEAVRKNCFQRLKGHAYVDRLKRIIQTTLAAQNDKARPKQIRFPEKDVSTGRQYTKKGAPIPDDWEDHGHLFTTEENGGILFRKLVDSGPGTERGLVSKKSYSSVDLSFEVNIESDSCFIAKIHQVDRYDQLTNSYHLMCNENRNYFARHFHIFKHLHIDRNRWEKIKITFFNGKITFYRGEVLVFSIEDYLLNSGYAFLGIRGGVARLRNISIKDPTKPKPLVEKISEPVAHEKEYEVLHKTGNGGWPMVSIITTVYDRLECLQNCIRSVKQQNFTNYEHIVVADCPPIEIVKKLQETVQLENNGKISFVNLKQRSNNWGIKPASIGIGLSRGKYICFCSDDNGYAPDHLMNLVRILENNEQIGFAYSSCKYDGRLILDSPVPRFRSIDLGQPLYRKYLFDQYLSGTLPYNVLSWDWQLIDTFIKKGVKWKHHHSATFLFKLEKYHRIMTISLIHPSRGRPEQAMETYFKWISKVSKANLVEHYLSVDRSDPNLAAYKKNFNGVTNVLINHNECVVQATNVAAKNSTGDLLIYLSDDFDCPSKWDLLIAKKVEKRSFKPRYDKFVVKVDDCLQKFDSPVLTIPIMSRALYEHLQYFWYPEYKSMFTDMDLFEVCNRMGVLINAPELKFEHKHYSVGKAQKDEIYQRTNAFWKQGRALYNLRRRNNFGI